MVIRKFFSAWLCALAFLLPAHSVAAKEQVQQIEANQHSLLERYSNNAQDLILKGLELVGVNYRRGGDDASSGLDCSGFVQLVFKESIGKLLPRSAREQSEVGELIDKSELKPGDLVFFNTMRRAFSHVGIYLGNNQFVHSPRSGAEVRVEDMGQIYWDKRYNGARRIFER